MKAALERLGIPGVAGLGLLLFCLSFYFGNLAPALAERQSLAEEAARLRQAAASQGGRPAATVGMTLADTTTLQVRLAEIASRHGLRLERTDSRLKEAGGASRLEIGQPLKGSYPALRAYLKEALALAPGATLDELALQRGQAAEPAVEAQLRISFALAPTP